MKHAELLESAQKILKDQKLSYLNNGELIEILESIFRKRINPQFLISLPRFFGQTKIFENDEDKLQWRLWTLISVILRLIKKSSSNDFKELMKAIKEVTV